MTLRIFNRKKRPANPLSPDFVEIPSNVPSTLTPVGEEISRVEESARHSAQVQFEAAKSWHYWNLLLGVPASFFGLFAGGAAFTEALPSWVIGAGALTGAALAGTMTVLGAERRATRAKTCANTFHDIQDDARRLLTINLATMTLDEANAALNSVCDRYKKARQTADAPARRFYQRALRNLREGGQQFAIDEAKKRTKDSAPAPTDPLAVAPVKPTSSANPDREN